MKTYTRDQLFKITEDHKLWWEGNGGSRANLRGANLQGVDLRGAILQGADLQDADLQDTDLQDADIRGANLQMANLRGANLQGAYLQDADIRGANLEGANLQDANLQNAYLQGADIRRANLQGAYLQDADLRGAKLEDANIEISKIIHRRQIVPEVGAFTGFKKAYLEENGNQAVLRLEIPASAKRVGGLVGRKCRASKAKVISAESVPDGKKLVGKFNSYHDKDFVYEIGKTYTIADYCDDPTQECAPGIHFYLTRQEAIEH